MARSDARFGVFLTAPALLIILVVVAFPLLYSLWMSLAEVNLLRTTGPALELFGVRLPLFRFVGLENYIRVFSDPLYWSSLGARSTSSRLSSSRPPWSASAWRSFSTSAFGAAR